LVEANLKALGLRGAEAAKAIGVMRQQLYNVSNGKSAVTPEMAVCFEGAFGGGADLSLRMRAAHELAGPGAKRRSPCTVSRGGFDMSNSRPTLDDGAPIARQ
jgi:addiction module HigA family antidote